MVLGTIGTCMHNHLFGVLSSLLLALFVMANGVVLVFWPRHYLRFYDFWVNRSSIGKAAPWRKDVEKVEYRLLGLGAIVSGLVILWSIFH